MVYKGGAGCLPLAGRRLGRGCGRQDLRLILKKLSHEAKVGRDHAPPLLDVVEGLLQAELLGLHEVRHADGGGPGDPSLTVDEDLASFFLDTVWNEAEKGSRVRTRI